MHLARGTARGPIAGALPENLGGKIYGVTVLISVPENFVFVDIESNVLDKRGQYSNANEQIDGMVEPVCSMIHSSGESNCIGGAFVNVTFSINLGYLCCGNLLSVESVMNTPALK